MLLSFVVNSLSFLDCFPPALGREIRALRDLLPDFDATLSEIRIRAGRFSSLSFGARVVPLRVVLSEGEIADAVRALCGGSLYAYADTLREGYLPLPDGGRVGVAGRYKSEGGKITGTVLITSLVVRIPRYIEGAGRLAAGVFRENRARGGLLIFSPPGCGKTTVLRSLAVLLSSGDDPLRTVLIDCRGELSGEWLGVGCTLDVLSGVGKAAGILLATRTLAPDVIVVDEIGGEEDCRAILSSAPQGVPLIATAHGDSLDRLRFHSPLSPLFEAGVFASAIGLLREGCRYLQYRAALPE